jgi:HEAT repeat protein
MAQAKILIGVSIVVAVGGFIYLRQHMETTGDRRRIAQHLQDLKQEFQKNPQNKQPLNEIVDVLNGDWSFARTYAACTLGELGPLAKFATPDLIHALNCGDIFVEREAARALGKVSIGMPDAVEPLSKKLCEMTDDAGVFAAESLGEIGEPALVAIPDLEDAARSPITGVAYRAQSSLVKLRAIKEKKSSGSPQP